MQILILAMVWEGDNRSIAKKHGYHRDEMERMQSWNGAESGMVLQWIIISNYVYFFLAN
ncbi:MAG TPA: hypothetical protein PKD51_18330 [Saprospiraceae bacterium]|nr:hypothetical protein [Saprospiraceae bacterium]